MKEKNCSMLTRIVASEDGCETYEVKKLWDEEKKKVLIIELYPTIRLGEEVKIDLSMFHLLSHADELGIGEVRIVNLYANVFKDKPKVRQLKNNDANRQYIEKILDENEWIKNAEILIAWGNTHSTNKHTIETKLWFLNELKKRKLVSKIKHLVVENCEVETMVGTHPLYLGIKYGKEKWLMEKFPLKEYIENSLEQNERRKNNVHKVADEVGK